MGYNMGRVVNVLNDMDDVPGATITRYCASSVQTTRMAFHAIKAGEGDVFISAGVETVSRFRKGTSDHIPDTQNPLFDDATARTDQQAEGGQGWHDPREDGALPDAYIAMGQTAENLAKLRGLDRKELDEFGVRSQNLAEKAIADGFWEREITPVTAPDGTVVSRGRRPPRRRHVRRDLAAAARLPPRRRGHRRQLLPAQRRRRRGRGHVRHQGRRARPHPAGADRLDRRLAASPPRSWASARSRPASARWPTPACRIGDIDLVEINEAFAAQVVPSYQDLGIDLDQLNVNGGAIAVGHPFGMTGARLQNTMLNSLDWHDKSTGLITMCVGGGQGMALILERV